MKLISVCIPTYEMCGRGAAFLKSSFEILVNQSFKNFEVVISDHSRNDEVKNLCDEYQGKLNIRYFKNEKKIGSSSANINNAIKKASGKLVKIIFQDDFLYCRDSLKEIAENFDLEVDKWMVTACEHSHDGKTFYRPFYPKYNYNIYLGDNTISSPSVLTIKNDHPLLFDENLIWLMDCDYYRRCYDQFGPPKILNKINVVNRTGVHQLSDNIPKEIKKREFRYVRNKFNPKKINLRSVSLVAVSSIKINQTVAALEKSMKGINYNEVILISDKKPKNLNLRITFKECEPIKSLDDYSRFMIYDLCKYVNSEYALVIQYDGFVLRPERWDNIFLNYDYVGAPWSKNVYFTKEGQNVRVGNGGFSLRSKKILNIFNDLKLSFNDSGTGFYNEDGVICLYHRKKLEDNGIQFAPVEVASRFSRETKCPDSVKKPFGFHGKKKVPKLFLAKCCIESILNSI